MRHKIAIILSFVSLFAGIVKLINYSTEDEYVNPANFGLPPNQPLVELINERNMTNRGELSIDNQQVKSKDEIILIDSIFKALKQTKLPYTDSTNFDNFNPSHQISFSALKILTLQKHFSCDEMKVYLKYSCEFDHNIKGLVFTVEIGQHELETYLAIYDESFNLSTLIMIAYDEIAESCFRKKSKIFKNSLLIYDEDFCGGAEGEKVTKTTIMQMISGGKLVQLSAGMRN